MPSRRTRRAGMLSFGLLLAATIGAAGRPAQQPPSETFEHVKARRLAVKATRAHEHAGLLSSRYVLDGRIDPAVMMSGGKPIPVGPTARLAGVTWDQLGRMTPGQIRDRDLFPYKPLPFADHAEGGMIFPATTLTLLPRLTRFDLDFDLPDYVLPEAVPAIYLTTRPDLGDIAKGRLVTVANYHEIFSAILNPKQLDGVRLLVTQFPQQQFNSTEDRRTDRPEGMLGVTCFDCHANGHTNGAAHLVGDIRPQAFRHRIETPSLRGVNIQRLFGSQRALKTIEDFTEFEQRGAYFDGDPVMAARKGVNVLDRGSQVQAMAEFLEILDFPPAPGLDLYGELDPATATESQRRGAVLFNGKAQCARCHPAPYYTDNSMHDLKAERFYTAEMTNGMMMARDGTIKTFSLRGIRDSPPYLHDGRCFTLEDTVEYFNLVLQLRLNVGEKHDLVAFLRAL